MLPAGSVVLTPKVAGRFASGGALVAVAVAAAVALVTGAWVVAGIAAALLASGCFLLRETLVAMYRWSDPELVLPGEALAIGGAIDLLYRRRARGLIDVSKSHVTCVLSCQERATYRQGTTSTTDTADVFEHGYSGSASGTPWGFEAYISVEVPIDAGAPTFDLGNNEVRWRIETSVDGTNMPADSHSFDVTVAPVLAEQMRGVQDS